MGIRLSDDDNVRNFNTTYGGFFNLRLNIAKLINPELGEAYNTRFDYSKKEDRLKQVISKNSIDNDLIHFLYESGSRGKVSPITCKKIYDVIDRDKRLNRGKWEVVKKLLMFCYKKNSNLKWNLE